MLIPIFRNNLPVVYIKPEDSSELFQKKQSDDYIRLNFVLEDKVELKIGDFISFSKTQQLYRLNSLPKVDESPSNNRYECIFEGPIHLLKNSKIFFNTAKVGGGYYRDYKFSLTGNVQTFLNFIISCINTSNIGITLTAGNYISSSSQTVEFNNWNAFEAITELSSLFGFSWYLEDSVLHFNSKNYNSTYIFQVGRLSGFTQLSRLKVENVNRETVVYGYGSTENLPPRTASEGLLTYDSSLLSENRLCFAGVNGESKLEKNTNLYGRIEQVMEFDIKPEFIGTVESVSSLLSFVDSSINFDIEQCKLAGVVPKLKFLSGLLMGTTFNISFTDSTKQVTVDTVEENGVSYPNELLPIQIGDTYTLLDLYMPEAYITEAETRLQEATQSYLDKQSGDLNVYEGNIDEFYIETFQIVLNLGDLIRAVSTFFGIDDLYEINELSQSIVNPNIYKVKFGDILPKGLLATLKSAIFSNSQEIYNFQKNSYSTTEVTNIIGQNTEWQTL